MGQAAFGGGTNAKRPLSPVADMASPKKPAPAPPPTSNGLFQGHDLNLGSPQEKIEQRARIPPFFVGADCDWQTIAAALDDRLKSNFVTYAKGAFYRLQTSTVEDFRLAQRYLTTQKVPFHTFTVGRSLHLKVVISGLPRGTTDLQLLDELGARDYAVENAVRLRSARGLSTSWLVTLCPDSEADGPDTRRASTIYDLTELFRLRVRVTSYRRPVGPRQCHRCQGLNHGSGNCGHPFRCVRCGGPHTGSQCVKPRGEAGTCCNCGGAHNANYRGCRIFKEWRQALQPRRSSFQPTARDPTKPRAPPPADSATQETAETEDVEDSHCGSRAKRHRPARNPANRRAGPRPKRERQAEEPPEKPPEPRPTFQRTTPRRRLDWPPGKAREQRPAELKATETVQPAGESRPEPTAKPDLRTLMGQIIRQLTALLELLMEREDAFGPRTH